MEKSGSGKRAYEFFDQDDDEGAAAKLDLVEIQRSIIIDLLNLKGHHGEEDEEEADV